MTITTRTKVSSRRPAADAACVAATDLASEFAVELAGAENVGQHVGYDVDDERVVTHYFQCLSQAYVGWQWAVTVARASRSKLVTVDESCLLPGSEAVLAPEWVPWSQRLQPGDLGVGDLLPTSADDPRLVPGLTGADNLSDDTLELGWELGLGRPRILSPLGADEAADRWINGEGGPHAPLALAAPAHCETCGFFVRLSGLLGQGFGVCSNEYSPSDSRVVTIDHGCGAHSEAVVLAPSQPWPGGPVVDELGYDDLGHS